MTDRLSQPSVSGGHERSIHPFDKDLEVLRGLKGEFAAAADSLETRLSSTIADSDLVEILTLVERFLRAGDRLSLAGRNRAVGLEGPEGVTVPGTTITEIVKGLAVLLNTIESASYHSGATALAAALEQALGESRKAGSDLATAFSKRLDELEAGAAEGHLDDVALVDDPYDRDDKPNDYDDSWLGPT